MLTLLTQHSSGVYGGYIQSKRGNRRAHYRATGTLQPTLSQHKNQEAKTMTMIFDTIETGLAAMELATQISDLTAEINRAQAIIDEYEGKTYKANDYRAKGQKYSYGKINTRRRNRVLGIEYTLRDNAIAAKAELEHRLEAIKRQSTTEYAEFTPDPNFDPFALFN